MSNLSEQNPLGRFTGLASGYAQHRPGYPKSTLDYLTKRASLCRGSQAVDLGSGTGISSRWLTEAGLRVIGIEPNDDMRSQAEAEPHPDVAYQPGTAEKTGLPDGCADLVLAAQAFHWFEPSTALPEIHRILKPDAWVALLWNERDENDPFTSKLGDIIRSAPDAKSTESSRQQAGAALQSSPLFVNVETTLYVNEQRVDESGLLGRVMSASYVPREPPASEEFERALRALYQKWEKDGTVVIRYQTTLHLAQKAGKIVDLS